jgi:hypothetical protein
MSNEFLDKSKADGCVQAKELRNVGSIGSHEGDVITPIAL